jgi:glycosyltransferase involved in cell wall biosynthesis
VPEPIHVRGLSLRGRLARRFPAGSATGDFLRRGGGRALDVADALATPLTASAGALAFARAWRHGRIGIGNRAFGRRIVMLVVSSLRVDPRVRASAQVLAKAGYEIVVIWPDADPSAPMPAWGDGVRFEPLPARAARFASRYPGILGAEMLRAALRHRPFAFHAHDLNTMPVALIAGRQTGAHVVCDHHEWSAENVAWSRLQGRYTGLPAHARVTNRRLEQLAFRHASAQITVCQPIADEMEQRYVTSTGSASQTMHVIRNIPAISTDGVRTHPNLRTSLALSEAQTLILYQGGVGPTRGLEPVIEALGAAPTCALAIRGPGLEAFAAAYNEIARRVGAANQLHLLPPVPSAEVVAACHGADAGLYTVANLSRSFAYALPNKIFEYLAAGLPVLTADYPEVRRLVVGSGVGAAFAPADPASIASAMRAICDPATRAIMRSRLPALLTTLDPGAEWAKLVALYEALPRTGLRGS